MLQHLYRKNSIPVRTMLMIIAALVFFFAFFSIFFIKKYVDKVNEDTRYLYETSSNAYISTVQSRLKNYVMAMEMISLNQVIRENIFRTDVSRLMMVDLSKQMEKLIDGMTFYLYQNGEVYSHRLYTYLPGDGRYFWSIEDLESQPWYPKIENTSSAYEYTYSKITQSNHLTLIHTINDFGTSSFLQGIGYQTITVDLNRLFAGSSTIFHNLSAEIFVIDNESKQIVHSTNKELKEEVQSFLQTSAVEQELVLERDGKRLVAIWQRLSNMDVTVLMLFYPAQLVTQGSFIELLTLALGASLFLVLMLVLLFFYWGYTRRLEFLIQKMDGFDEQQIKPLEVMEGNDEIARIDKHLERMQNRIRALIQEEYTAKIQKINAQYEALIACVNPHFLYNTLNTISAMACMDGADSSVEMINALSDMFRYSSEASAKYVRLEDEIKNITDYLYIQEIRYQKNFMYQIEIGDGLQACMVPKLILQPVVENAFKHGFREKAGGRRSESQRRLKINAVREQDDLLISVWDNGIGMCQTDLEQLQSHINLTDLSGERSGIRIGLHNVHQRIRLLYGEGYGLSIESMQNEYTCIGIRLTCHRVDQETM